MYPAQAFIDELRRERRRIRRALHRHHPLILHWLWRAREIIRRRPRPEQGRRGDLAQPVTAAAGDLSVPRGTLQSATPR